MDNNSSKQILLSVIGVAILVIAVVGISFAFFSYTRTGGTDNVITTGSLTFVFADGDEINLTNHFPMTVASANEFALVGTNICQFTVSGNAATGTNIDYEVYAVRGTDDAYVGKTRFRDSEIFVKIAGTSMTRGTFEPTGTYGTGAAMGTLADNDDKVLLGTGTVTGQTGGENDVHTIQVRMWVSSDVVTIADNGATYTSEQYANLYYTMKILVTAANS